MATIFVTGGSGFVGQRLIAALVARLVHVSTEAVLLGGKPLVNAGEAWPLPEKPVGLYPKTKGAAGAGIRGPDNTGGRPGRNANLKTA